MTKYFKRGLREFYSVSPEKVTKIENRKYGSYVTIMTRTEGSVVNANFLETDALEGQEISREEFAEQFKVASRLIVMEP
jgi:hypothetical protein